MKTEDIKKMAQAWLQVQEASKEKVEEISEIARSMTPMRDKFGKSQAEKDAEAKKKEAEATKEAMDPVDQKELKGKHKDRKDKDINNDGKVDSTDKYLHNRRKTVAAAIKGKKKDQEVEVQTSEATVNELKKSTLSSYIKKASGSMAGNAAIAATQASSSMKKASPDVKRNIFKRAKGIAQASDKLAKESVEEAATHKPGVASPAGEGLSPSAKDQLAKKTPAPAAFDVDTVNKKTFDAIRASAKKSPMRTNDNAQGDKTPPKAK